MKPNLIKFENGFRSDTEAGSNVKVLNPNVLIKQYPQLPETTIHAINDIARLPGTADDSYIFMYRDILLKFAIPGINDIDSFQREIIIGLEINKLNNPGFVRTIGYYEDPNCKIPILDTQLQQQPCIYLYLEKISGPTMKKFIKTASLLQFKNVMSKLVHNYKVALDLCNYTHYDFHLSNLIISTVGEELMPVIIDFEASHISFLNGDIGEDFTEVGRYPNESNWIYDFFKFLGFCWIETNEAYIINNIVEAYENKKEQAIENIGEVYRIYYMQRFNKDLDDHVPIEETIFEYIDRAAAEQTGENREQHKENILAWKEHINKAKADIQTAKDLFQANRDNMQSINDHCIRLLTYFHADVSDEWLLNYHNHLDRYFSSWRTEEGYASKFDDFILYCDSFQ